MNKLYPNRIICMTEESVELFHLLGRSDVIAGVSVYAKRPVDVKKHPIVSAFTHANLKKISGLNPDLVIGFSDIQKDIAKELVDNGLNVLITNQRSIEEIFQTMLLTANLIGEGEKAMELIKKYEAKIQLAKEKAILRNYRPKVYLEEWDEPQICGIRWFSELIEICGGEDIFAETSREGNKGKDRFVTNDQVREKNPDIILASWCGKKVDIESIKNRPGFAQVKAVQKEQVFELAPEIYLQPGPALFVDGIDQLINLFDSLNYH
jgi:iron complex transport system substrate-binding protein